ncbi:MAG TPA: TRAP transporter small permease [Rhizobiaceae bacterium]|nr:TRAP transporter small permease [Rhizobiaceae bacterium]
MAAWTSGIGIALLMLPTVADVTYRKVIGPSLAGMVEVSEVGVVIVAFLAMAAALRRGAHVGTPIFTSQLNPTLAERLRILGCLVIWIALALMVWGSWQIAVESFQVREFRFGLVQMPIWPAKMAVPVGLVLMLIELTIQIWERFTGARHGTISHDA